MAKIKKTKQNGPLDLSELASKTPLARKQATKLFIPACGDRIVLAESWTFTLYFEGRNHEFGKALGVFKPTGNHWKDCYDSVEGQRYGGVLKRTQVTLPAGLALECDRVYIRTFNKGRLKEGDDYDSITWRVVGKNGKTIQKLRFWAKLADCCQVQYSMEPDGLYRDRVKLIRLVQEA
jgi:hypothetical protein